MTASPTAPPYPALRAGDLKPANVLLRSQVDDTAAALLQPLLLRSYAAEQHPLHHHPQPILRGVSDTVLHSGPTTMAPQKQQQGAAAATAATAATAAAATAATAGYPSSRSRFSLLMPSLIGGSRHQHRQQHQHQLQVAQALVQRAARGYCCKVADFG